MDDEPPHLTLVSSGEGKRDRSHFEWRLSFATRNLAANMMRVICDAGRPYDLVDQVIAIRELLVTAPDGMRVSEANEVMAEALTGFIGERDTDMGYAIELIKKGALRTVAARLLHQDAQANRRNADLWDGIGEIERVRERAREKRRAEEAAYRATLLRAKPRKTKPKVATKPKISTKPTQHKPEPVSETPEPRTTAEFMKARQRELRGEEPHRS